MLLSAGSCVCFNLFRRLFRGKCWELSRIGSPALVFEPDNDTDDYTAVTAYINGEFAAVKAEEEGRQLATCDSSKNINVVENVVEKLSPQAMILLEGYGMSGDKLTRSQTPDCFPC